MLIRAARRMLPAAALIAAPLRAEPRIIGLDGDWACKADSAGPASRYDARTPIAG